MCIYAHIVFAINTYLCIFWHISRASGTKYAKICKYMRKCAKICKRKMQYMLINSKYAIRLALFLAVSGPASPTLELTTTDSCKHFIVHQHTRIRPIRARAGQAPRPPRRPQAAPPPAAGPALARPLVAGRSQQIFATAQLRWHSPPCMVCRVQLLRPPPRRQPTPPLQHPGSEQATTPSIRYAAVQVLSSTCTPHRIG